MRFRKKPVEIEAVEVNEALRCARGAWTEMPKWLEEAYERGIVVFAPGGVSIKTLEGTMMGTSGDWIIKGVKDELYPCRGDIFEATYESVET